MRNRISGIRWRIAHRSFIVAVVTMLVGVGLLACARTSPKESVTPVAQPAETTKPAAQLDAKKVIQEHCTVCHGTWRIKMAKVLPIPARPLVDNMIKRGAKLTPEERKAVIEYLSY